MCPSIETTCQVWGVARNINKVKKRVGMMGEH